MSETKIKDGTGGKFIAGVNKDNRLLVDSIQKSEIDNANQKGLGFNINTGVITLTNDTETPILYLKNNSEMNLHIDSIAIGVGPTTGGSGGIPVITVVRNPTGGTIVSTATPVDISSNRNYGSTNTLSNMDIYKGVTGATITGGEDHIIFFQVSNSRLFASISEVLPKGTSIGIKFNPQTSNTSQDVYAALICHQESI